MREKTRSPTHEAALSYAARGWKVFPVQPPTRGDEESGKHPHGLLVPNGKLDASSDPAKIDAWWGRVPHANVGLALAESGLIALDVDVGQRKDGTPKRGRESLAAMEADTGELERTLSSVTGGGGLHALYVRPAAGLEDLGGKIGFRDGLDLLVNGYVVLPPSEHWSGRVYRWSDTRAPIALPGQLVDYVRASVRERARAKSTGPVSDEKIPQGNRNNAMFRLACILHDTGIGEKALKIALLAENERRFDPPLSEFELVKIAESAMRNTPSRDAALGSVIADVAREARVELMCDESDAPLASELARIDRPPMRFYATGFPKLDELLGGGYCTRQVCGVIGPPSAGKTGFALGAAVNVSPALPALYASTELPRFEAVDRLASARDGSFPWRDAIKGLVKREKIEAALADLRVHLLGNDDIELKPDPLGFIFEKAARLGSKYGIAPMVVIDYVQLLARDATDDNKRARVGELSARIRRASQAFDCPVLAVFIPRREAYAVKEIAKMREEDNPRAYLSAAKESGDIEFDCATILYLDADTSVPGAVKPARIAVARCRVGSEGFAGARAVLDVGRWLPDEKSLEQFKLLDKRGMIMGEETDRDSANLYDIMEKRPGRTWTEYMSLAMQYKMGRDRCNAARARLLDAGRIEEVSIDTVDAMMRPKKAKGWRVVNNSPLNPPTK